MKQNYNNESLAAIGHGKWKSALGHTLLIIGFLMGFGIFGAYAQEMTIPDGLKMEKKWVPDDYTGQSGHILVETFVTGHSVATHVPTDIVLVLDVSGSMKEEIGDGVSEYHARPEQAYTYSNYPSGNNDNPKYYYYYQGQYRQVTRQSQGNWTQYYTLYFNVGNTTYYLSDNVSGGVTTNQNQARVTSSTATIWTGVLYRYGKMNKMEALQTSVGLFVDIIAEDATTYNVDHRISIVKYAMDSWGPDNSTSNSASYIEESNEFTDAGYNYTQVLIKRRDPRTDGEYIKSQVNSLLEGGATASDYGMEKAQHLLTNIPQGEFATRNKVVVMFTDGAPTHGNSFNNTVANTTISNARVLKNNGSVGGTNYTFNATVFSVGVFDSETDNIRNYMNYVSSNYPNAQSMTNAGTQASTDYYFKAESAGGLSDIFEAIAGASGAMSLPAATIVQDVVSPSFHLPTGATGTVTAYAPKCTNYDETTGKYTFEGLNDAGTLVITDGIVQEGQGGENKLPANFVTVNGSQIQMSGFNFSEHWCGWVEDDHGNPQIHGRKIVIKIPVEINEGLWGDGMQTNDPEHSYIQAPDPNNPGQYIYYGPFNNLTADVQGDVWTEIVVEEPTGFDPMNIDSPEDLAWFISVVNGRLDYEAPHNTNAPQWSTNGKLTADIDMSAHNWVPIGSGSGHGVGGYTGTFDGNGHVITGLKNNASKYFMMETELHPEGVAVVFPGMFSKVGSGGVVKNVFVLDSDFRGKHHNPDFVHHGIIADTLLAGGQIFNCEAAGRITCNNDDPTADQNLIYGGLVGLNQGTIHSCMAMAELTGYTLGGMIGENRSSFSNGFTNGVYNYLGSDDTYKVGGIAGTNAGTIDNCYVRFERDNTNLDKAGFDMLVGEGTGTVSNSYIPQIVTYSRPSSQSITTEVTMNFTVPTVETPEQNPDNSYTLSVNKTFYNMFTNDNSVGGTWGPYTYTNSQGQTVTNNNIMVYSGGTSLLELLEGGKSGGASWKRTTAGEYSVSAGDINEDYPVLQFGDYTCLGSADGIRIDYAASLNEMLHRHNNGALNENTTLEGNKYRPTNHAAITGGAINLFANDDVTLETTGGKDGVADNSTADGVVVYIDEKISLLQDASSSIEAYTGQTLKAINNTAQQAGDRWHNISSSLSNSQFGWEYGTDEQVAYSESSNPCGWNLYNHDEDYAFFPIDLSSYHRAEFYCFYEPQYHWINFRRNSNSHWHMDNPEVQITYDNEDHFTPGKGYLAAVDMSTYWSDYDRTEQFLQNRGTLNNGPVNIAVTAEAPAWTGLQGYNLLGNPYQSFLDFNKFVEGQDEGFWTGSKFSQTCAVYDPSTGTYLQTIPTTPSQGAQVAGPTINMHQGFFIQVGQNGTAHFTNAMRTNEGTPNFRGAQPAYPLVNFTLTDSEGNKDIAVLEIARPENDGAKKLRMGSATGRISLRHDNENCAILFRDMTEGSQPLYFDADEDGMFTLSWNTANADFRELTLVDNITGVRYDMLTHDSYVFEGHANDYKSRFKVVIGSFTGIEEEETVTNNFAFFDGSEWVVNGQGRLTVTDMMGRTVFSANLENDQNRVNLNGVAQGMYLMQVSNSDGSRVQKIVVR